MRSYFKSGCHNKKWLFVSCLDKPGDNYWKPWNIATCRKYLCVRDNRLTPAIQCDGMCNCDCDWCSWRQGLDVEGRLLCGVRALRSWRPRHCVAGCVPSSDTCVSPADVNITCSYGWFVCDDWFKWAYWKHTFSQRLLYWVNSDDQSAWLTMLG